MCEGPVMLAAQARRSSVRRQELQPVVHPFLRFTCTVMPYACCLLCIIVYLHWLEVFDR